MPSASTDGWRPALLALLVVGCAPGQQPPPPPAEGMTMAANPVFHFEIPVTDMDRAIAFYEAVFGWPLERRTVDGYDMAFFPRQDGPGSSGALAKGDVYRPSREGVILYFDVPDIDAVLGRATARGARILYPRKDLGEAGYVAEFEDSEGNRIALTQVAR